MTWLYPQSSFSVVGYSYTPDRGEVTGFKENFEELQELVESSSYDDDAAFRLRSINKMFEMDWLTSSEPVKMDEQLLNKMGNFVSSSREEVTQLLVREEYNQHTREWLALTLHNMVSAEGWIAELRSDRWKSRRELDHTYRKLHQSFARSLDTFRTFYERRSNLESEQ
ncbi:hypothetical protein [Piscibacillus halophilus]|uniref:hypothetical protein n=1 Tax=Piscibacillus halophilus TaxID=571933 RepID=UPI002409AF7D|nr:hypothetical protein [Piscibacillus halophilus]